MRKERKELLAKLDMVGKIEELVRVNKHVSFVELQRWIGDETKGNYQITMTNAENCVLWNGVSEEFADALYKCLHIRKTIVMKPTDMLVYFADGAVPRLPIVKRPPKGGYKKPHWLPVVFNPVGYKPRKRKTI